ncbi:hypothetical protein KKH39_02585 [Patescibacteria group bacterium]|nr:hypothetical protein [Patescibacteria group bacterium]
MNLAKLSNKELFKVFDYYYNNVYTNLHIFHWIQTVADFGDNLFSKYLMKYLKDKIKNTKYTLGEVFSVMTTPTKDGLPTIEYKDLLKILSYILSKPKVEKYFKETEVRIIVKDLVNLDKKLDSLINNHVAKYSFLGYGTTGPGWAKDYFVDILGSLARQKAEPSELLDKLEKEKINTKNKQTEFVRVLKIDKNHQDLFKVARGIIFTKGSRKESMFYSYQVSENLYREIGRRYYLSVNQVRFMHPFEFKYLLLEDKFSAAKLNDRYKFSLHYSTGDMERDDKMLTGDEAKKFLSGFNIIKEEIKDIKILEGDCASPGRAQGEIKLINVVSDMKKMEEGNILVSIATNPDLVPAIKKASAIITDVGGITCHAAIVSRELGIPCVIGTRIATKVLKDGDLVAVDATHGKINIVHQTK